MGSVCLQPHTDPYDVFIAQVSGEKDWTICTPNPEGAKDMNAAQRAQLQEIQRHNIEGCTSYSKTDLAKMDCQELTLNRGDTLYLPKGIVHYATTRENISSTHLTISLFREGHTWRDVLYRRCQVVESDDTCRQLDKRVRESALQPQGMEWNDLATAPFADEPVKSICQKLSQMITGTENHHLSHLLSASIAKANAYEKSSKELLALLPAISACTDISVKEILKHEESHRELTRQRRSSGWTPPCRSGTHTCYNAWSCDCDAGNLL